MAEPKESGLTGYWKLIDIALKHYGPHAFGLVMFLILWLVAVKPEIESNRKNMDQMQELVRTLNDQSETNMATAQIMERTVSRLEKLEKQ